MKTIKLLLLVSIIFISNQSKAQCSKNDNFTSFELTYSTEDNAIGFNAMQFFGDIGFIAGLEMGAYTFGDITKVNHQKYRVGLALDVTLNDPYGNPSSFIIYAMACHNEYQLKYDEFDHIDNDLPTLTAELGMKYIFNNKMTAGFQYDIIHTTGGFSLGICLNKR